jgi:hypothetical protein
VSLLLELELLLALLKLLRLEQLRMLRFEISSRPFSSSVSFCRTNFFGVRLTSAMSSMPSSDPMLSRNVPEILKKKKMFYLKGALLYK